jgi:DNA repair ATPase RecN
LQKKGITIWILSTLTFISLIHLVDAATAVLSNNQAQLLQVYPLINEQLTQISTNIYLCATAVSTFVLWGITSLIAFDNPVESFLNKILSDAQKQQAKDSQTLENNTDFFNLMYETMEENNENLGQIKDLVRNVRGEVKDMQRINESMEKARAELTNLKKHVTTLEEKMIFPLLCQTCRKPLRTDFKLCPYCGKKIDLQKMVVVTKQKTDNKESK